MKTDSLILIAAAGFALWAFTKYTKTGTSTGTAQTNQYGAQLVKEWSGWKYYTDGTAIGPDGAYYMNGALVYQP